VDRERAHELEVLRLSHNRSNVVTEVVKKNRVEIPKFGKEQKFDVFISNFERSMRINEIAEEDYVNYLFIAIQGHEVASRLTLMEADVEYQTVKTELATMFRLTAEEYRRQFRETKGGIDSARQAWNRLDYLAKNWYTQAGLTFVPEVSQFHDLFIKEQFLKLLDEELKLRLMAKGYYRVPVEEILEITQGYITAYDKKGGRWEKNGQKENLARRSNWENAGSEKREIKCYACGKQGHISRVCTEKPQGWGNKPLEEKRDKKQAFIACEDAEDNSEEAACVERRAQEIIL
jgi:hypothetical protein